MLEVLMGLTLVVLGFYLFSWSVVLCWKSVRLAGRIVSTEVKWGYDRGRADFTGKI